MEDAQLAAELDYNSDASIATDAISLTSSTQSQHSSTYEFVIDSILYECSDSDDGSAGGRGKRYLVKWEGYPLHRATWEPASHLNNCRDVLLRWDEAKMRQTRGFIKPFSIEKFERMMHRRERSAQNRKNKRARKRKAQRDTTETSDDLFLTTNKHSRSASRNVTPTSLKRNREHAALDSSDEEDEPLMKRLAKASISGASARQSPDVAVQRTDVPPAPVSDTIQMSVPPSRRQQTEDQKNDQSATLSEAPRSTYDQSAVSTANGSPRSTKPSNVFAGLKPLRKNTKLAEGSSVLSDWTLDTSGKSKNSKKLSDVSPKGFASLSNMHRARKAAKVEPKPLWQDVLSKGLVSKGIISNEQAIADRSTEIPSSEENQNHVTASDNPVVRMSSRAEAPTDSLVEKDTPVSINSPKYTCWFWAIGNFCRDGNKCAFEHYTTSNLAPARNELGNDITCPFWFEGKCFKRPQQCMFAHKMTSYIAGKNGAPIQRLDPTVSRPDPQRLEPSTSRSDSSHDMSIVDQVPKRDITCHFWERGGCIKPDDVCQFAHKWTNWIATPPNIGNGRTFTRREPATPIVHSATKQWDHHDQPITSSVSTGQLAPQSPQKPLSFKPFRLAQAENVSGNTVNSMTPFVYQSSQIDDSQSSKLTDTNFQQRSITVRIPSATDSLPPGFTVVLDRLDVQATSSLYLEEDSAQIVSFDYVWDADLAKTFLDIHKIRIYCSGAIIPADDSGNELEMLAKRLEFHTAGALHFHPKFTLLVCSNQTKWDFLGREAQALNSGLYYYFLPPLPRPTTNLLPHETIPIHESQARAIAQLNLKRLFTWNITDEVEKTVFLMFSQHRNRQVAEVVARFFIINGITVFDGSRPGSWDHFCHRKQSSGVIFFPSDFSKFNDIPDFYKVKAMTMNFFQLDVAPPIQAGAFIQPKRIFECGRSVYISDECFEKEHSIDTLKLVNYLNSRMKRERNHQVLGRPGLLAWLDTLAETDENASKISIILSHLTEYETESYFSDMEERKLKRESLFYSPPSCLYDISDHDRKWQADGEQREQVYLDMLQWFSWEAIDRISHHRKFWFVTWITGEKRHRLQHKFPHLEIKSPSEAVFTK